MIRIGTDCSGIEAPVEALKQLGISFEHSFSCEKDKYALQSIKANYKPEKIYTDITKRKHGLLPDIDIYVCGFPCQPFSLMGNKMGTEDSRSNIMYQCIKVIKKKLPKVFILENVKNFKFIEKGKPFNYLISELKKVKNKNKELAYNVYFDILNTKDYGIPQNRERLFIVGFLKKQSFEFPKPISLEITMQDLLIDNPDVKYFLPEKGIKFVSNEKNLNKKYTQIDGKIALCQKRNQQFNWHGDFVMDKYFLSEKVKKYVLV
jgi:DNA (cytosine-5)-methyltransferase 1